MHSAPHDTLRIILLLGTARNGRQSEKVAGFVRECLSARPEFSIDFVDIRDELERFTEEREMKSWKEKVSAADGLVIVSPEYNHGYPGELKILLDSAYDEYARKPAAIVGVSSGLVGGARMVEQLRLVLTELGMTICRAPALFTRVQDLFDGAGVLKERETWQKKINTLADEVAWFARALKNART